MELVFIFTIVFIQMFFIHLFEIMQIIRAFGIYTFMDEEMLAVFFMNETVVTMRAFQNGSFRKTVIFSWRKMCLADLAQNLAFLLAIVPHEIVNRGIARRAMTGCRNITISVPEYRPNGFVVTTLIIGDEIYPIPSCL